MVHIKPAQHEAPFIHLSLVFLFILLLPNPTFAQNTPMPLSYMAYTTRDESKLYIHGGFHPNQNVPLSQFSILDLSQQSWDVSSPPWETPPGYGGPPAKGHSLVIRTRPHQDILTLLTAGLIYSYDLRSNSWSELGKHFFVADKGTMSVGNPETGLIYTPADNEDITLMGLYQPIDNTRDAAVMYPGTSGLRGYSAAWAGGNLYLFGGQLGRVDFLTVMLLYDGQSWQHLSTTGIGPGVLVSACMVPAFSKTKLVLFGGLNLLKEAALPSIYIFDFKTNHWEKGTDVDRAQARYGMACAAAGDSFVVFGGQNDNTSPNFKPMLIYNFKTKKWGDQFYLDTPPPPPPPPKITKTKAPAPSTTDTKPTTTTDSEPSATATPPPVFTPPILEPEEKTNTAVIGGAVGAAALVSFMLLFIYRRYKKRDDHHGDQYPHDVYPDRDYWGTEQIHSHESFNNLQGGSQHAHFPLEAVGHEAGNDMDPNGYNSPASPPYLQQPSAVYSHSSPTYFLSPCSNTSQSPYSDPALTADFSAVQPLPGDPPYPQNMYQSNEPQQSQVPEPLQEIWGHQQGLYYGTPYQPPTTNMHQGPIEDGQFQQDAYGQPFISPPNVMPQSQSHEPMPLLLQAPRLSYDSHNGYNYGHNGYNYGHNDQVLHVYAQNGNPQEYH